MILISFIVQCTSETASIVAYLKSNTIRSQTMNFNTKSIKEETEMMVLKANRVAGWQRTLEGKVLLTVCNCQCTLYKSIGNVMLKSRKNSKMKTQNMIS